MIFVGKPIKNLGNAFYGTDTVNIDPAIKNLVSDLNATGFRTISSCQGQRSPIGDEIVYTPGVTHSPMANIVFDRVFTKEFCQKVNQAGLGLWRFAKGSVAKGCFGIMAFTDLTLTPAQAARLNLAFEQKVRDLFRV